MTSLWLAAIFRGLAAAVRPDGEESAAAVGLWAGEIN
jgi:hypothetical protein